MQVLGKSFKDDLKGARICRAIASTAIVFAFIWLTGFTVLAQTADTAQLDEPTFTKESVQTTIEGLDQQTGLSDDDKARARTMLENTLTALTNASANLDKSLAMKSRLRTADRQIATLQTDIEKAQTQLNVESDTSDEPMREEALIKLEQDLVRREAEQRTLDAEFNRLTLEVQSMTARQLAAPKELSDAQASLGEIRTQLTELGTGDLDFIGEVNRRNLSARLYSRQAQISALEEEVSSLAKLLELTTAERNLADYRLQFVNQQIEFLEEKTGQRRLNDAADIKSVSENRLAELEEEGRHPIVLSFSTENVALGEDIVNLAKEADRISKISASTRTRLDNIERDLQVAKDLISLGKIDRRAGTTLRRLANQLESLNSIRSEINTSKQALVDVTQQSLITQEILRNSPIGSLNTSKLLDDARKLDPEVLPLEPEDEAALQSLNVSRRDLLNRIFSVSSARISERVELQSQQEELLTQTSELKDLLDEKLLWVPSVAAIDLSWPGRAINGAVELFSPTNFRLTVSILERQTRNYWPLTLLFFTAILSSFFMRRRLWTDIEERSKKIGRVVKDNYWHSPAVILSCLLIAIPLPLFFMWLAIMFKSSQSPAPVITGLFKAFIYLAIFVMFFLSWRAFDREHSLFAAHYKLPPTVRKGLNQNFKWFIPLAGISTALMTVSEGSPRPDIYEGFSVFAFIVTALALSYFCFRVLWVRRNKIGSALSEGNIFQRHSLLTATVITGLPLGTAVLAAMGYYDTANEVLGRLFISGVLVILTYVIYGLIRRTVVVAQRRLMLKQAYERRDAMLKARQEMAEASEKGERAHIPIDHSAIDITMISRQSLQLLNTLIVLGFALLLWIIWSSLLPALSIFNEFQVWEYSRLDAEGNNLVEKVTLWNILQAFVILGLTFVAAKNLPGFLEIFILNRTGVDQGTRYAVVTVLGYIIIGIGIIISFDRLGLQWSQLRWIVTGLSVGIGFGLQKIIANFISGLIILFERPVRIGDYVSIGDQNGTVTRIKIRATTLIDLDNREILIPNEALVSERMINWTLSSSINRIIIPVGIAYGSDTDAARDIMLEVLQNNPEVLKNPAPSVLFLGFGDSSLDFELRIYVDKIEDRYVISHSVHTDINKALEKAGITIPFPQRDLHIIEPAGKVVAKKSKAKPKPKPNKS